MKQRLVCSGCGALLAQVDEDRMECYGFGMRVVRGAYEEDLAWAICPQCQAETPFDSSFVKHIVGFEPPPSDPLS